MSDEADHSRDFIRRMIDEHQFFQPLNALCDASVESFVNSFDQVHFNQGDVVCRQNEEKQSVFVIESGQFDIFITRRKQDGVTLEQFLVATIGGGVEFGMMEYQYDVNRLGTVIVSDDSAESVCWECSSDALAEFINANPILNKRLRVNRLLYKTLKTTDLLSNIDQPNITQKLIYTFQEERLSPGSNIINQGDPVSDESKLFVLLDGEADAYIEKPFSPTIHSNSYKSGDAFGDMSFLYDCPRPFSVVASSACTVLTLKKAVFESLAAKGAGTLKAVFDKHARHRSSFKFGAADENYMSSGAFVDAMEEYLLGNQSLVASEWTDKLALIREFADLCSQGDLVPFTEFIKRTGLMNKENPEIEIAFRLFDQGGTGSVQTTRFREVMIDLLKPDNCPFDIQAGVAYSSFPSDVSIDIDEFRLWLTGDGNDWRRNKKMQKLIADIHMTCEQTYNRYRQLGTEEALSDDGVNLLRAHPSGVSLFPVPYLISGAIAGLVSRTAVYPLTRLKILMQTGILKNFKSSLNASYLSPKFAFQGNGANLLRAVPFMGLQFGTYEYLTQMQLEQTSAPVLGIPQRFICGGLAGLTALSLTFPLDVARARMAVMTPQQKVKNFSSVETLLHMVKKEGVTSMFKGYFPAAAHVFPFIATEFTTYEFAKNALSLDPLVAGGLAGAAAAAVTYPLEVIRRRLQVQNFVANQSYNYTGFVQGLNSIVAKEGMAGLYRGFLPNMLRVVPAVGVSFASYEMVLPYFRDVWEDHRFERNYEWPEEHGAH